MRSRANIPRASDGTGAGQFPQVRPSFSKIFYYAASLSLGVLVKKKGETHTEHRTTEEALRQLAGLHTLSLKLPQTSPPPREENRRVDPLLS